MARIGLSLKHTYTARCMKTHGQKILPPLKRSPWYDIWRRFCKKEIRPSNKIRIQVVVLESHLYRSVHSCYMIDFGSSRHSHMFILWEWRRVRHCRTSRIYIKFWTSRVSRKGSCHSATIFSWLFFCRTSGTFSNSLCVPVSRAKMSQ